MPAVYVSREAKDTLPERHPHDHYPTPIELCRAALGLIGSVHNPAPRILDPGSGTGVWGKAARERWPEAFIVGIEKDDTFEDYPTPDYDFVLYKNFLTHPPYPDYDIIMCNPPYKHAEEFIRRGFGFWREAGEMIFLLRTEFQNSRRGAPGGLFDRYPPHTIYPLVQRPSFNGGKGTQPQDYCLFYWRYGWRGRTYWQPLSWR